jgi:hypothetical protein
VSNWLLGFVACIYLWVAINYFFSDKMGMCLAFVAYALANVGFILANRGT